MTSWQIDPYPGTCFHIPSCEEYTSDSMEHMWRNAISQGMAGVGKKETEHWFNKQSVNVQMLLLLEPSQKTIMTMTKLPLGAQLWKGEEMETYLCYLA